MAEGMTNAQNVPATDTDFEDRPRSEEERVREKDRRQTPPDKQPPAPVEEPPTQPNNSIYETPTAPLRVMRAYSAQERRIF